MEPASTPQPAAADPTAATSNVDPVADPATGGDQAPVDPAGGQQAPVVDPSAAGGEPAPAAAAPKGPNLTARLAALSKENREARKAVQAAKQAQAETAAKLAPIDALLAKAQGGDLSVIPELFKLTGLDFKKIVEFHAGQGEEPAVDPVTELKNEIADLKKGREDEAKAAAARAQEASRAEMLGSVRAAIKANADKFEICERLGDEAARDVFAEVADAWSKAGRPQLEPGEFDEAVVAAIEVQELRYEERGKKLAKKARQAAADAAIAEAAGKAAPGATNSDLPADISGGKLSDKDEDIIKGLIDKTAPAISSQRARPRTISRDMGGSAPPRVAPTGDKDPRDALRDVLAPFVQSAAIS